jgi:formamidopyrimidine-DNA glycosylase
LPGAKILQVERHGKFIRIVLESSGSGTNPGELLDWFVHLGMTGQLGTRPVADAVIPHTHGFFVLDDGRELRYTDIRRFGRMFIVPASDGADFRGRLGAEPLELSVEEFCKRFGSRRARVKAMLLDQHVLGGVGNIYADEALFRARIHPARIAGDLTRAQLISLHEAVRGVLAAAIQMRGSSVSDYLDSEGRRGDFQNAHQVYQRTGEPCTRCGRKIRRMIVAGRSSHFCPRCQPAPRVRKAQRAPLSKRRKK